MWLSSPVKQAGAFYGVAMALALIVTLFASSLGGAAAPVTMLSPILAVAIMGASPASRASCRALGLACAGLRLWPFAIMGPIFVLLANDAILLAIRVVTLQTPIFGVSSMQIAVNLTLNFGVGLALAACEETGWRGYMLPRLVHFGAVRAMLIVGLLQGIWHLPLMLFTPSYHSDGNPLVVVPLFLTTLTLAGIFYGYLRVASGSVWPVAIAHAVFNLFWNLGREFMRPETPEAMEYLGGESGLLMVMSLAIAALVLVPAIRRVGGPEKK